MSVNTQALSVMGASMVGGLVGGALVGALAGAVGAPPEAAIIIGSIGAILCSFLAIRAVLA